MLYRSSIQECWFKDDYQPLCEKLNNSRADKLYVDDWRQSRKVLIAPSQLPAAAVALVPIFGRGRCGSRLFSWSLGSSVSLLVISIHFSLTCPQHHSSCRSSLLQYPGRSARDQLREVEINDPRPAATRRRASRPLILCAAHLCATICSVASNQVLRASRGRNRHNMPPTMDHRQDPTRSSTRTVA